MNDKAKGIAILGATVVGAILISNASGSGEVETIAGSGSGSGLFSGYGSDEIIGTDPNFTDVSKDPAYSQPTIIFEAPAMPTGDAETTSTGTKKSSNTQQYYSTNNLTQSTNKAVDIFTKTSSTDPDRFAQDPTTGAIADRYAQQSISPAIAEQRKKQANAVPSFSSFAPSSQVSKAPSSPSTSSSSSSGSTSSKKKEKTSFVSKLKFW